MRATFHLDMRQSKAALKDYLQATGKDAAYCVNRQTLNVAIKTGQNTPVANVSLIRKLPEKEWWAKKVAKQLSGTGVRLGKTGKRYKGRRYIRGQYTVQEAREASKKMVRGRVARAGYIKSGWLPAIRTLTALKLGAKGNIGKVPNFYRGEGKKPPGDVRVATPGINPIAIIKNSAKGIQVLGPAAFQKGLILAAADMRQFIREQYTGTARSKGIKVAA